MSDIMLFKDVWQKNDAAVEAHAIAAWTAADALLQDSSPQQRVKQLCVVGYSNEELAAISTCQIIYIPRVRETMAVFRVFIAPKYREAGFVIPLTNEVHATMERFALRNPAINLGGTLGVVAIRGAVSKPLTHTKMVLAGYTDTNHPILVKWFDHFELDEKAARARDPRKQNF
jgi:hypothetical protein